MVCKKTVSEFLMNPTNVGNVCAFDREHVLGKLFYGSLYVLYDDFCFLKIKAG